VRGLLCERLCENAAVIGQTVSHYRVLDRLGSGGMGVVYRAEDLRLRRTVALKFLHPAANADATARERFLREAHCVARLDHPNVCTVFEIDTTGDDQMFIAMAYYEGETLAQRLKKGPLDVHEAIGITLQVLAGLGYAHEERLYHRDIKPSNLMITRRGEVKILDFGIARPAGDTAITQVGSVVGTTPYMSPEQLMGYEVDQRSDLWAVGVLLTEMVTGERPFRGDDSLVRRSILSSDPEPITNIPTGEVHLLHPVISRALAKEPEERYQTAREMHDHLRRIQDGLAATIAGPATARSEPPPSIAVLPLSDLSSGHDQEYFCAGLSEELISSLTRLQGLRVASRTSSFQFKDRAVDVRRIGAELNVRTVLEGSVRKSGNRLRITVQLTDVSAGYSLWAARYDREMEDIFAIQEEIAESIADTLRKTFDIPLEGTAVRRQTGDLEAYHAYLKGRYFWNKRTEEDLRKGIDFFQEAVGKDPRFALAHAGLADSHLLLGIYGAASPREVMPEARDAAARALELDKTLAEAHTSRACVAAVYDWDWPAAEESFQRAIRLAPGYATARQWYAINTLTPLMRFEEAAAELETALQLDPLSLPVSSSLAIQRFYARQYPAAIEQCRRVLEIDPDFALARFFLGLSYAEEGRPQEAVHELRAAAHEGSAEMMAGLAYTYGRYGAKQEARSILEELLERSRQRYVSPALIAQVQVGLGDMSAAMEWLDWAVEAHATELVWLRVRPFFDRLYDEPGFNELLDRLGLPA